MNLRKTAVLSAVALLVGALGSNVAEAQHRGRHFHGGGGHFGGGRALFFAAPIIAASLLAARYYYPPSYYYPPAAYYPPTAPVYIEQGESSSYAVPPQSQYQQPQYQQPAQPQGQNQPDSQSYWYYCQASRGYYPHVQNCPGGWQRVAPQQSPR